MRDRLALARSNLPPFELESHSYKLKVHGLSMPFTLNGSCDLFACTDLSNANLFFVETLSQIDDHVCNITYHARVRIEQIHLARFYRYSFIEW